MDRAPGTCSEYTAIEKPGGSRMPLRSTGPPEPPQALFIMISPPSKARRGQMLRTSLIVCIVVLLRSMARRPAPEGAKTGGPT